MTKAHITKVHLVKADGGRTNEGFSRETRDCTVRALATITGAPYAEAHWVLGMYGRKNGHGINMRKFLEANDHIILDHKFEPIHIWNSRGIRVALVRNPFLAKGTWLLGMPSHVAALVDGKIVDTFDSTRKDIRHAWKVTECTLD